MLWRAARFQSRAGTRKATHSDVMRTEWRFDDWWYFGCGLGQGMTISSRTPEGDPNVCPICGHDLRIEPSIITRDGTCPNCGCLLWFSSSSASKKSQPRSMSLEQFVSEFGPLHYRAPWEAQESLLWLGTKKFGPPSERIQRAVAAISELTTLERLVNQLVKASSWNELEIEN